MRSIAAEPARRLRGKRLGLAGAALALATSSIVAAVIYGPSAKQGSPIGPDSAVSLNLILSPEIPRGDGGSGPVSAYVAAGGVGGKLRTLPRQPNHLKLTTDPPGATLWVDGIEKGKTPIDTFIGAGGHRIVVVMEGYRIWREVVDTTKGEILHKRLVAARASEGAAFVNVECTVAGKYPIVIDDQDTGFICPAKSIPVQPGMRRIGIFVPSERSAVVVEQDIPAGLRPRTVTMKY